MKGRGEGGIGRSSVKNGYWRNKITNQTRKYMQGGGGGGVETVG